MTGDRREESLAEQAAAWVPPWARADQPAQPLRDTPAGDDPPDELAPEVLAPDELEQGELAPDELAREELAPDELPAVARTADAPAVGRTDDAAGEPAAGLAADAPAPLDDQDLRGALEAIMLVVDEPVSETVLAQVLGQPTGRVAEALEALSTSYTGAGHGFDLRRAAGGWRLYTRPEFAPYVERFILDGQQARLTQAALETLAIVAYRQPVTRSRISGIRGVNCDGVIRTLVSRGLVQESGSEPDSGALLYRTSTLFLEKLGLNSVDELPALAPFLPDDVDEVADAQR